MKKPVEEMDAVEILREIDEIWPLGDLIYNVRSAAVESQRRGPWDGDGWDHPMVRRWSDLCTRVKRLTS